MPKVRLLLTYILVALALHGVNAQDLLEYKSHIIDDSTGESIPYAAIFTAPGRGTLSNSNGDFTVVAAPDCLLHIRFVGYDDYWVHAQDLPSVVRLKPATQILKEVSVVGVSSVLNHVIERLNKEYKRDRKKSSKYFCRVNELLSGHHELFETFLSAQSAVNLRDISFYSGKRANLSSDASNKDLQLENINFHHAMELGPMIQDNYFWLEVLTPLDSRFFKDKLDKYYDMSCTLLRSTPTTEDPSGKEVYCIHMRRKELDSDIEYVRPMLTGDVYVDPKTYQLLQFDGKLEGIYLEVKTKRMTKQSVQTNISLNLHVNYKHDKKFTEVNSLACTFSKKDFHSRILLFNIDNLDMKMKKLHRVSENMLTTLEASGFKDKLWKETNIIQRTQEEERIALNDTTNLAYRDSTQKALEDMNLKKYEQEDFIQPPTTLGLIQIYKNLCNDNRLPQEKVFLHMDNTHYFLGDTIWFAAYTRNTRLHIPSQISGLLYVELLNEDGFLVERKQIKMSKGRGNGFFALPPRSCYAGFYELRAYTNWQLNWGVYERPHSAACKKWFFDEDFEHRFFRDYEKLYSRVFPVYDAPHQPGEYKFEMNNRHTQPNEDSHSSRVLQVNFFPEGGSLVQGKENYVAYEAQWSDGQWAQGNLIVDGMAYPTLNRGRGVFRVGSAASARRATFVTADGRDSVSAVLPVADAEGVALHVEQNDSTWEFTMDPTDNLESLELALTVMHDNELIVFHPFVRNADKLVVPCEVLPEGVCQVTVFGMRGEVYADRIIFSKGLDVQPLPTVEVDGLQDSYQPWQKVSLTVKAPNHTNLTRHVFSFSVQARPDGVKTADRNNIYTEMLLSSEIRGYVPDAWWFFEQDDTEHRTALNLLMMVQGWRRFSWQDAAFKNSLAMTRLPESAPILSGRVWDVKGWDVTDFGGWRNVPFLKYRKSSSDDFLSDRSPLEDMSMQEEPGHSEVTKGQTHTSQNQTLLSLTPKNEAQVHGTLLDPEQVMDPEQVEMRSKDGYFRLRVPDITRCSWLLIDASDKSHWSKEKGYEYPWVQFAHDPESRSNSKQPEFKVCVDFPYPRFVKPFDYYQLQSPWLSTGGGSISPSDSESFHFDTTMGELNISARKKKGFDDSRPAFVVDAVEAYNTAYDAGMMPDEQGILRAYLGLAGREVPMQFRFGKKRANYKYWIGNHEPDSIYQHQNLESAADLSSFSPGDVRHFASMSNRDRYVFYTDFVPRQLSDTINLDKQLSNTHMGIYLYHGTAKRTWFRGRQFVMPGFSAPAKFYHVDYSTQSPPQESDNRRTLYWNPHLVMDQNGQAVITFYNNSKTNHLAVEAEGQATDGKLLWLTE